MAFSTTQLTAVEAAIASGELVVQYDGRRVEYRSMQELIAARDLIKAELIALGLLPSGRATSALAEFSRD